MKASTLVKFAACLVLSSAFASSVAAQPIWDYKVTDLGGDRAVVEVLLDAGDGEEKAAAYDLEIVGINGATLINIPGFSQPVPSYEASITPNDFDDNYSRENDSWFDDATGPLGLSLGLTPRVEEENLLRGGFGNDAAAGQAFGSGRIAYLLFDISGHDGSPDVGQMTGSYARSGVDFPVDELLPIPEPAALLLSCFGLVGLGLRRRG